jgi:hypothetical protein
MLNTTIELRSALLIAREWNYNKMKKFKKFQLGFLQKEDIKHEEAVFRRKLPKSRSSKNKRYF